MKISYDPKADAIYIQIRAVDSADHGVELEDGVIADMDADGHIVGLQILDARDRLSDDPSVIRFEWLAGEEQPASATATSESAAVSSQGET